MSFEGQQVQGSANIVQKLQNVGQVSHSVRTTDIQPSTTNTALLIFVTGLVQVGNDNPIHFSEMFQLVSTGANQYYVHNIVFRLCYGQ